jgi:hypothetical protein
VAEDRTLRHSQQIALTALGAKTGTDDGQLREHKPQTNNRRFAESHQAGVRGIGVGCLPRAARLLSEAECEDCLAIEQSHACSSHSRRLDCVLSKLETRRASQSESASERAHLRATASFRHRRVLPWFDRLRAPQRCARLSVLTNAPCASTRTRAHTCHTRRHTQAPNPTDVHTCTDTHTHEHTRQPLTTCTHSKSTSRSHAVSRGEPTDGAACTDPTRASTRQAKNQTKSPEATHEEQAGAAASTEQSERTDRVASQATSD